VRTGGGRVVKDRVVHRAIRGKILEGHSPDEPGDGVDRVHNVGEDEEGVTLRY